MRDDDANMESGELDRELDREIDHLISTKSDKVKWTSRVFGLSPTPYRIVLANARHRLTTLLSSLLRQLVFVTGLSSIVYGVWLFSHPLGFIVGGVILVLAAFVLDRGHQRVLEAGTPSGIAEQGYRQQELVDDLER